ncbi:MAG: vitamin K epoxide reductase family protein [Terriglobales bacterium]
MGGARVAVWIITIAALVGIVLSTVSLKAHYSTEESEFCDLSETFNCDLVNRSTYSRIGPVPVAAIGLAGYLFLLVFSRLSVATPKSGASNPGQPPRRKRAWILFISSLAGLGFALYLTYIEAYVLVAWCILCLGSLAIIFIITLASGVLAFRKSQVPVVSAKRP